MSTPSANHNPPQALQNYSLFLQKIDARFNEIRLRHPDAFMCRASCYRCCQPDLGVTAVEIEHIRQHLAANPMSRLEVLELAAADPHRGAHCRFLRVDGSCSIYAARPMVCRILGAPLTFKPESDPDSSFKDVCPLNFTDSAIESLGERDFFNLDTSNSILEAINEVFVGDATARERHTLDPGTVLGTGLSDAEAPAD